jgi:GTP-binding protein
MTFQVNKSPFAGQEGKFLTSRQIKARLEQELKHNVALRVQETDDPDRFRVSGRGELHLSILIETMRREGYEMSISRPRVIYQTDPKTGQRLEPIEEVQVDVDDEFTGIVVEQLGRRRGELQDMRPSGAGKTRLVFHAPSRGLIGYHGEFLTDTRGTGIMNKLFHGYAPYKGEIEGRRNGVLIANSDGSAVAYALWYLEERGQLFVSPGDPVYEGMIIGENSRDNDLEVNPLRAKQLSNIRTTSKDEAIRLTPPVRMTLEKAIAYIEDAELVEVTPKAIRLRKRLLDPHARKRAERQAEAG